MSIRFGGVKTPPPLPPPSPSIIDVSWIGNAGNEAERMECPVISKNFLLIDSTMFETVSWFSSMVVDVADTGVPLIGTEEETVGVLGRSRCNSNICDIK